MPFENITDPSFFFYSSKHKEALSRMLYAIRESKGAAILTGECGGGKTLLSKVLLRELSSDQYHSAIIFNPVLPPLELIKEIIYQLGGDTSSLRKRPSKIELLHYLNEILSINRNANKRTIIVIDEAQTVSMDSFEELRLLLNFQFNDGLLFTLIFLGQPELKNKMNNLPQLKQRLAVRYHLKALTKDETKGYVQHRLTIAGSSTEIFREDAFNEIYKFSGGLPRRINNICDMALLVGCGEGLDNIGKEVILQVAEDLEETPIYVEGEVGSQSYG